MIYRALDCGCYSKPNDANLDLWFEAASDTDAHTRAERILSLLWAVPVEDICLNGMPRSEIHLERASIQSADAGDRRWLESGSHGSYPTYGGSNDVLVFLCGTERERFDRARASAVAHARAVLAELQRDDAETYGLTIQFVQRFIDRHAECV